MTRNSNDWPIKTVNVSQLHLDLENVRVRATTINESAALNYLYASDDVMNLAHELLRDGYVNNELPLVCYEGGAYVVLEGNRRVAALKGLTSPAAVPSKTFQLERLLERYSDSQVLETVRVMVAPSRDSVQPLLARLHTKLPKRKWPREQQAEFFHAQLSEQTRTADLQKLYPAEAKNIPRFIRMAEVRHAILALKIHDAELSEFARMGGLGMTSFEYAYTKAKIQESLGVAFDAEGRMVRKASKRNTDRVLLRLLQDFKSDRLNTRCAELRAGTTEHEDYVRELWELRDDAPAQAAGGADSEPLESDARDAGPSTPAVRGIASGAPSVGGRVEAREKATSADVTTSKPVSRRSDTKSYLDGSAIIYNLKSRGLEIRLEELLSLNVTKYPNATHDLIRTVLECSLKQYFRDLGKPLAPKLTLGSYVTHAATHFANDARMTAALNALNRSGKMKTEQFLASADALNSTNHEPDTVFDSKAVHFAWASVRPVIVTLMAGPPSP